MNIPVSRIQQAAKAPRRDLSRGPAGQFGQRFATRKEGLHDDQPAQDETVTVFPHTGHTAKQERNEQGQVRDLDHNEPIEKGDQSPQLSGCQMMIHHKCPVSSSFSRLFRQRMYVLSSVGLLETAIELLAGEGAELSGKGHERYPLRRKTRVDHFH
jgi:hypothetical protein